MAKKKEGPVIQTQTPDEMLDGAVRRNLAIGEKFLKKNPRPIYVEGKQYRYSFDKTMTYTFVTYDGHFYRIFERNDKHIMRATRYSSPPEEILIT